MKFRLVRVRRLADVTAAFDPLLDPSPLPFGAPAFDRITPEAILPALRTGIASARAEIEAIAREPAAPTFANTIVALERAGAALARVRRVFWTLASAHATPAIRAIEGEVSALLSRHGTATAHDPRLFERVHALWTERDRLNLDEAQRRLLDDSHRGFIDGGALLGATDKARFAAVAERLSLLGTRFGQNVLAATSDWSMLLTTSEEAAGLPEAMLGATARRAASNGLTGHLVTLDRGEVEAFLTFAECRDLRERMWRAFVGRCDGGPHDNRAIVDEMLTLRQERAALLGYPSYADHALADTMAGAPEAAEALLMRVWQPAVRHALEEQAALQRLADADGIVFAAWDWRYYAEHVRRDRHALDATALSTHLTLDRVRDAAFTAAGRLYGLTFSARADLPGWHPDVVARAVGDAQGRARGLLYTDFRARPDKHGGAWMGALRVQEAIDGAVLPIVYIVANFADAPAGSETCLSIDEARTLFHEFGHALHALLSDVVYPSQSGTAVARDFVEFPSKFMEHWIVAPDALATLGVPAPLIDALGRAETAGQGFATVEFLASAIIDMRLHRQTAPVDAARFTTQVIADIGMPATIVPRHGVTHFTHVFDGGYASLYYSYLWSEVLDADAFEAFTQSGDLFDPVLSARLAHEVLSRGDTRDPMAAYIAFRGRVPDEGALLRSRGF